ncbi:hypothetical protein ACOCJ4_00840 [Knoellia sp. CPCC 206435]|uniref:hypothetical protein n=1 Tax=Knoellia terrae TaxID=3404797 RepID=UPI003B42E710
MEQLHTADQQLRAAIGASLAWYEQVFALHGIPTRCEDGLWSALGEPPRWHSAAKTLRPDVDPERVVKVLAPFPGCGVADSFGTLDLSGHGFAPLFRATWLHRPPSADGALTWPEGWSVLGDPDELAAWNEHQDTTGVLVPALLEHPDFTFLVRREGGAMVAGAVLHRTGEVVDLSNTWAAGDEADEVPAMVVCAEGLHPGLPMVGYSADDDLSHFTDAGFEALGPQVVWVPDRPELTP